MATIKEDYVSFETAKLLKEKGFDEACDKKYFGDDCSGPSYIRESWEDGGDVYPMSNSDLDDGSKYADISAPTLQMACKWLREVHKLIPIVLTGGDSQNPFYYWFRIDRITKEKLEDAIYREDEKEFSSYEAAEEVAIKYCLENLI